MSTQPITSRFSEAMVQAAELHRHQVRKGTTIPYVSHLLAVTAIAMEFGADEDEAIAALLHDAIEDAPEQRGQEKAIVVRRLMEMKFGRCVLELVEACTDADIQPKPPWSERKVAYVDGIAHKSASALLVSACDKLHNARSIVRDFRTHKTELWKRFNPEAGPTGTVGYYRGLVTAVRRRAPALADDRLGPIIQELDETVSTLERESGVTGVWPPVKG